MLLNVSDFQNVPEWTVVAISGFSVCLIVLDIWQGFEYALGRIYVRVLNMPRYSYNNNIIIVTIIIILEFFFARFVHPGATKLTILSFFNTSKEV